METTRPSKRIWWADGDYIGATGVNSPEEFAELALARPEIREAFDGVEQSVAAYARHAVDLGLHVTVVPAGHLHQERWNPDRTFDLKSDWAARPGRGYVKVLGMAL